MTKYRILLAWLCYCYVRLQIQSSNVRFYIYCIIDSKYTTSTQSVWVSIFNLLPNIFVYTFGKKKHYEYSYKFYYTTIGFNDSLSLVIVFNVE